MSGTADENKKFLEKYIGASYLASTFNFEPLTGVTSMPQMSIRECINFDYSSDKALELYVTKNASDLETLIGQLFTAGYGIKDTEVYARSIGVEVSSTTEIANSLAIDAQATPTLEENNAMIGLLESTISSPPP